MTNSKKPDPRWLVLLLTCAGLSCHKTTNELKADFSANALGIAADPGTAGAFYDRSLKSESVSPMKALFRGGGVDNQQYINFVDRALVIRAVAVVDNGDFQHSPDKPLTLGPWTFPALIQKTLQAVGFKGTSGSADPVGDEMRDWANNDRIPKSNFGLRWQLYQGQALGTIPLRLLAVVNRIDLTRFGGDGCPVNMACGAEFRFVYGGITVPKPPPTSLYADVVDPYFTLILEFELPSMSMNDLSTEALAWYNLAGDADSDRHRNDLEKQLATLYAQWTKGLRTDGQMNTPADSQVRIRANSRSAGSGPWTFAQYELNRDGLVLSPLDQEFNDNFPVAKCVTASVAKKWKLDQILMAANDIPTMNYNFFKRGTTCANVPALATCAATLSIADGASLTLDKNVVNPPPTNLDDLRYGLSIGSCSGCHGLEAQGPGPDAGNPTDAWTHFDQVKYRETNFESKLSRFLTGADTGEPAVPQDTLGWPVNPPPVVPNCGPPAQVRTFNDLLRLALFVFFLSHPILIPVIPVPADKSRHDTNWQYLYTEGWNARQSH